MFTIGSVCIDRRGFHWKGPEGEGANASSSIRDITLPWGIGGGGADPADEWRRGSRNYLEAKRGLREVLPSVHARDMPVHITPLL